MFPKNGSEVASLWAATHLRSCSALLRFMYCLTVYCTSGPEGAGTKALQLVHTIKGDVVNLNPAGLTPTVGHDLQGQRQQVVEGGIQHHGLDLWV